MCLFVQITTWLDRGPRVIEDTVCIFCGNNTQGNKCEECKDGYFRDESAPAHEPCKPCECHGHSATCDKVGGRGCQCTNHTQTPTCDGGGKSDKNCVEVQV